MIFLLLKTHKKDKLEFFSRKIISVLQSQRIEAFRVEDLATSFVVRLYLLLEVLLCFSQFIVNSGLEYNLSVVISILLQWINRICLVVFPSTLLVFLLVDFFIASIDFYFLYYLGYI